MAARFREGGKLIAFGNGPASTDAQHIAVEFIHPVIVGKRALPAISLTNDVATLTGVADREGWDEVFAHQLRHLGRPRDIALGLISPAGRLGTCCAASPWPGRPGCYGRPRARRRPAASASPRITSCSSRRPTRSSSRRCRSPLYHVLWELVHVFLEQPSGAGPVKCVTCSDEAVPRRVTALLEGGRATVDVDGAVEEVSVELVDAAVGRHGPGPRGRGDREGP